MSVSSCITSFLPFICVQDCPHFTAHHNVVKDNAENSDFLFLQLSCDDSFKTVPSTSSEPVDTRLPTPARNLPVPAKGQVIAMEGSGLGPLKVVLLSVGLEPQTLKNWQLLLKEHLINS